MKDTFVITVLVILGQSKFLQMFPSGVESYLEIAKMQCNEMKISGISMSILKSKTTQVLSRHFGNVLMIRIHSMREKVLIDLRNNPCCHTIEQVF